MVKMNGFAATRSARQFRYVADKVGKAQKCLPTFIHFGRNMQLAEVRKYRFHTWQAGHQGALIAFLPPMSRHTWQAMHRGASMRLRSFYNTRKQCLCIYTQTKTPFSLLGNIPNPLTISPQSMNLIAWKYGCAPFRRLWIFTRKGTDGFFPPVPFVIMCYFLSATFSQNLCRIAAACARVALPCGARFI